MSWEGQVGAITREPEDLHALNQSEITHEYESPGTNKHRKYGLWLGFLKLGRRLFVSGEKEKET
jgi:hypothetical protein